MIIVPITICMLIAKYLCLLKPFWLRKNNKTSVLLIIIILAMILSVVKIQVWLNDWNNDFFNALSQKETDKLWQLVLWFPALLGIFVLISVNKTWLIKLLTIRWREWLTDYYLNRWFTDKNYYFTQIYGEDKNTDNPDQRIAEDILLLISKTLSLSFGFIQSLSMLITFTVILWQSAGTLSFTVGGTEWNIQVIWFIPSCSLLLVARCLPIKWVNVSARLMWRSNVAKRLFELTLCSIISKRS